MNGSKQNRRKRDWHFSMSVALGLGLGFFVLTAVAGVLGVGLVVGYQNTADLLNEKADLIISSQREQTAQYLDAAQNQVSFITDQIETGEVEPDRSVEFVSLLQGALSATPQIIRIQFIDNNYRLTGVERQDGETLPIFQRVGDDKALRSLADAAKESGRAQWGNLLWRQEYEQVVLNYQKPVKQSGRIAGVMSVWVSSRQLSDFLSQLNADLGPNAFILHGKDHVLAHPMLAFGHPGLSSLNPLPRLARFTDPVVTGIWSTTEPETLLGRLLSRQNARTVSYGEQEYVIFFEEMTGYSAKPLFIGTYFEAHDLAEEIVRLKWAIIFCIIMSVLAFVIAAYIGRQIAQPVRRLADGAKKVHGLDLANVDRIPRSFFLELDDAARSFNVMLDGLKWFERYVPKGIVRRLIKRNPEGEIASSNRRIAIMFTDIAGFTSLSENLTAPATVEFLNEHFSMIARCVEKHGGTVDKYIGDSVMAIWGAPDSMKNLSDRACRCSLEIAQEIAKANKGELPKKLGGKPLKVRIGIHTGEVMVGNIGSTDRLSYTVIGDAVNVAQRLMETGKTLGDQQAEVNILISGEVRSKLKTKLGVKRLGRHPLRGREEQVSVYMLKGKK